jgi:hypothetical protein
MVRYAELVFRIHCFYDQAAPPSYRIYVDDDLITERTFAWNPATDYVQEHVAVEARLGSHTLRVENITPKLGTFVVENLQVDGLPSDSVSVFNIT